MDTFNAKDSVLSFVNPFDLDTDGLLILSSGATASEDVTRDVLRAESAGRDAKVEFITNRLREGKDFFLPIKRMKLKRKVTLHSNSLCSVRPIQTSRHICQSY